MRATLAAVSEFHHDTAALKRLTPPPIFVQLHHIEPLAEGSLSEFSLWFGPLPVHWFARHSKVSEQGFTDTQESGPLKYWAHTHTFKDIGQGLVQVNEHIEYEHHADWRGLRSRLLFAPLGLSFLFNYRALATRRALE